MLRLTPDKPGIDYGEAQDRMSKTVEEDNSPTVVSKFPDRVNPDEESDETAIDKPLKEIDNTDKLLEDADKSFRTIETQDVTLPGCLKGHCVEPGYESIMEDPDHFVNLELKEVLVSGKSEGIIRLGFQTSRLTTNQLKELSYVFRTRPNRLYRAYQQNDDAN